MHQLKRHKRFCRRAFRVNTRRAWEKEREIWTQIVKSLGG